MNLIAFASINDPYQQGALAGCTQKSTLMQAIDELNAETVLLIATPEREGALNRIKSVVSSATKLETVILQLPTNASLSDVVNALRALPILPIYAKATLLSSGTPQERAALWILHHEGILNGPRYEPNQVNFSLESAKNVLVVNEPPAKFEDEGHAHLPAANWTLVAHHVGCIGKSPRFRQTLEEAAALSNHPTPILLMGETGSGKEVLARFIHQLSPRAKQPLITVNCAALPESLAESILFGHEKGSFTGAYKRQKGKFEQAHTGTLFLDELGELSLANQAKLLRVLEQRQVEVIGSETMVDIDVRIIAATNRNLAQEVARGRFREDLYYRLRAGEILIPALRERSSDIPVIALHLLERFNTTLATPKQLSPAALKFLEAQRWPGNVRDLMNTIERAALLCPRPTIEPTDFKIDSIATLPSSNNAALPLPVFKEGFSMEAYIQLVRKGLVDKALEQARGNRSEAARILGVTPQAIHKYLKLQESKYQIVEA